MSRALVLLAEGFEEIEALAPVDLMRRAQVDVVVAGVGSLQVASRRGVRVVCDAELGSVAAQAFDAVVLPGGRPGADNLASSVSVRELLARRFADNALVAAVCAAPAVVLGSAGYLAGRQWTGYPGTEKGLETGYVAREVVRDGNLLTSRGVGTTFAFALALIAALESPDVADRVARETLLRLD